MISEPLRVLYVVPNLGVGGAERHVTTLLPEWTGAGSRRGLCA
jgi:hypothetical protein